MLFCAGGVESWWRPAANERSAFSSTRAECVARRPEFAIRFSWTTIVTKVIGAHRNLLHSIFNRASLGSMKPLSSILLLVFLFTGCANRVTAPASHLVLPRNCVTDMQFTKESVCRQLSNGSLTCNGLLVEAACLKSKQPQAQK